MEPLLRWIFWIGKELIRTSNGHDWHHKDRYYWRQGSSGEKMLDLFIPFFIDGGTNCSFHKIIWQNIAPPKVKVHLWILIHNVLLTGERLRLRHLSDMHLCMFCKRVEESTHHIFLDCCQNLFFWDFLTYFGFNSRPLSAFDWWLNWIEFSIMKKMSFYRIWLWKIPQTR